jgi:hypothetical protein
MAVRACKAGLGGTVCMVSRLTKWIKASGLVDNTDEPGKVVEFK